MKYLIAVGILLVSCKARELEFDRSKWNTVEDGFYTYREQIVNDLIHNHLKKGMSYRELIELVGNPEKNQMEEKHTVGYEIMEDYAWDIDPVETKTLIIRFTNDSLISDYEIEHWKR